MRTFEQLTKAEQKKAVEKTLNELLQAILEGMRFNDKANKDTLQASLDQAMEEAESRQTPWFAHEYIMDATYDSELEGPNLSVADNLEGMARADAEDAVYPEKGERVIRL